ncbi:unnamed protein product [Orchesella dallaii]|uniref:Uncharacterized protein n=1 Tax=Orchesella dallaii TaxID=48710 RepID=A0ABP1RZX7_9HEXA
MKATAIMAGAGMELRQWEASIVDRSEVNPNQGCGLSLGEGSASVTKNVAAVLGVLWNKEEDTISCEIKDFDLCVLLPKVLIQESWTKKIGWDEPVPEEVETKFITWGKGLHLLSGIQVPRHFHPKREGIVKKASSPPCEVASESDVHVDETVRTKSGRIKVREDSKYAKIEMDA